MGVHYHLLGRIPQLGGYHRSKDHLIRDLNSLRQDHQILQLCHRDLLWERVRLSLPVPLNHPLNPQNLAVVQGVVITMQLPIYSGKCWCKGTLLKVSEDLGLIPLQGGLRTCWDIIRC